AGSPHLRHLVWLDVHASRIDDAGLDALLSSPYLTRLVSLDLSKSRLTSRSARRLAEWPGLGGLLTLDLGLNGKIEEGALAGLSDVTGFEPLSVGLQDIAKLQPTRDELKERFGAALRYL